MSVWDEFDNIVSEDDIKEIKKNNANTYSRLKEGVYTVELLAVEPTVSKAQNIPMVKFTFKDCDSQRMIYHNMFLQDFYNPERTQWRINSVLTMLRKLGNRISFESVSKLSEQIMETKTGGKYKIEVSYYSETSKYPDIKVVETVVDDPFVSDLELGDDLELL